jgi:hypothetical protein
MVSRMEIARGTSEVLFEFVSQGNYVKVIAVDTNTNTEITIVGDRRSRKETLQDAAVKKLRYVIEKKSDNSENKLKDRNLF